MGLIISPNYCVNIFFRKPVGEHTAISTSIQLTKS